MSDLGERLQALDAFIRCPECGSERATLVVDEGYDVEDQTDWRGSCPECDHETPWVYGTDRSADDDPLPIVHCSDGPRLILADGSVVKPRVAPIRADRMIFLHRDQGAALYGPEVDDPRVSVAFVDDPTATEEIDAIAERRSAFGFSEEN